VEQAVRTSVMCNLFWYLPLLRYFLGIHGVYKFESFCGSQIKKKDLKKTIFSSFNLSLTVQKIGGVESLF
jgi:hypothetical protein